MKVQAEHGYPGEDPKMAISEEEYGVWLESIEQTLSDGNIEEYLTVHPEDAGTWIDWPDPTYLEQRLANLEMLRAILLEEGAVVATAQQVLTTGNIGADEGRATITFPAMVTPIVSVAVLDPLLDGTTYHVAIQAVTTTSATIRVIRTTTMNISGFDVFAIPQPAAGVSVHVTVRDAG